VCLTAERAVTTALEASCRTPIGVHAVLGEGTGELAIDTFVGLPDGREWIRDRVAGDPEQPAGLGRMAAERLLAAGAAGLLAEAERTEPALDVSGARPT
jgi:hydroxymethylbilane synthase